MVDANPEKSAEEAWLEIARKRMPELESGKVKPVTWDVIKEQILEA